MLRSAQCCHQKKQEEINKALEDIEKRKKAEKTETVEHARLPGTELSDTTNNIKLGKKRRDPIDMEDPDDPRELVLVEHNPPPGPSYY